MISRRLTALGLAMALLAVAGCGGGDTAPTAKVSGTVTYNGDPVGDVSVGFIPEGEGGRTASGTTDASGKFTLSTFEAGDGAVVGKHKVIITEKSDTTGDEDYSLPDESARRFPAKYESPLTSDLEATVEKGKENTVSLDMTD